MNTRNQIFVDTLYEPISKMIECIFNRFQLSACGYPVETIQQDAVGFVVSKLETFSPQRGKSFGYFSVIAKRYLIQLSIKEDKEERFLVPLIQRQDGEEKEIDIPFIDPNNEPFQHTEFVSQMLDWWDENIETVFATNPRHLAIARNVLSLFGEQSFEFEKRKEVTAHIAKTMNVARSHVSRVIQKMKCYIFLLRKSYIQQGRIEYQLPPTAIPVAKKIVEPGRTKVPKIFTEEEKETLREQYRSGKYPKRILAVMYRCGTPSIDKIIAGITKVNQGISPKRCLTAEQAISIRKDYATGQYLQRELASKYNIRTRLVSRIVTGQQYRDCILAQ